MLNKYDLREKEYIRLEKRLNEIRKEIRNQPYIEVEPFQRGWEVSIILRDDISNRKDVEFISHLIEIGYQKFTNISKLEYVKLIKKDIYQYQYKHRGKIYIIDFIPSKLRLSEKQYEALSAREKRYFRRDDRERYVSYSINIPTYWIKLQVKPNIYNKIMDKNGELESEYSKIQFKLQNSSYFKYQRGYHEPNEEYKVGNLILKEQLNELNQDE